MVWGAEDRDLRIGGCPDVGVGGAEEEEAGAVGGGGEVGPVSIPCGVMLCGVPSGLVKNVGVSVSKKL